SGPLAGFVNFFRAGAAAGRTEYQAGIPQALRLRNSPQFSAGGELLDKGTKAGKDPAKVIEVLYLGTIARRPTAAEQEKLVAHVAKAGGDGRKAYGDILWALVNSPEFAFNP